MRDDLTVKDNAEFFRLGLQRLIFDTTVVAKWADQVIAAYDKPPLEIIEVTLSCNRGINEAIAALREVKGEHRPHVIIEMLLAYLYIKLMKGEISCELTVSTLYRLAQNEILPDDMFSEIMAIDEYWLLADEGYEPIESAQSALKAFLEKHIRYIGRLPLEI
jgi:hypothetical protein